MNQFSWCCRSFGIYWHAQHLRAAGVNWDSFQLPMYLTLGLKFSLTFTKFKVTVLAYQALVDLYRVQETKVESLAHPKQRREYCTGRCGSLFMLNQQLPSAEGMFLGIFMTMVVHLCTKVILPSSWPSVISLILLFYCQRWIGVFPSVVIFSFVNCQFRSRTKGRLIKYMVGKSSLGKQFKCKSEIFQAAKSLLFHFSSRVPHIYLCRHTISTVLWLV